MLEQHQRQREGPHHQAASKRLKTADHSERSTQPQVVRKPDQKTANLSELSSELIFNFIALLSSTKMHTLISAFSKL
jgi:hypothetical protein